MSSKLQKYLVNNNKEKVFTNKTFSEFRNDLLKYANEFYSENIIDFSETSLGGLFLDFASIVGDSLVYYAEQQFSEMNFETATDPENISRFLKQANIKGTKASPSSVYVDFTITVESTLPNDISDLSLLPIIHEQTEISAQNGTKFLLAEDIDFSSDYVITNVLEKNNGNFDLTLSKKGLCTSGRLGTEFVSFDSDSSGKFLKFELENDEITQVISVTDNENNEYYEVEYLSQDFVFQKVEEADSSEDYLTIKPSPYRFIIEEDYDTGKTTLRFGNGDNTSFSNNIIPDPLDLLLPIKNRDYVGRIDISPTTILSNNMLGVSPLGKTLTITYKYGGGKNHNVSENTINTVDNLVVSYPKSENLVGTETVSSSLVINNLNRATGGSNIPTLEDLKNALNSSNKMQSRIVTYEDLLTRLLTMPSNFGKIYKAAALENENFTGIKDIFIVCKNKDDHLEYASDALKKNISKFINENRLIGDNFNIVDSPIFNFGIKLKIKIAKGFDSSVVTFQLLNDILSLMRFDSFDIGQAINVNRLTKIVESNPGVTTIVTPKNKIVVSKSSSDNMFDFNTNQSFSYNNNKFNPTSSYEEGMIFPLRGGIFELKNPINDIEILIAN